MPSRPITEFEIVFHARCNARLLSVSMNEERNQVNALDDETSLTKWAEVNCNMDLKIGTSVPIKKASQGSYLVQKEAAAGPFCSTLSLD